MTLISLGDMAQTFTMRRLTSGIKQEARLAGQELVSGRSVDISKKLRGELSHFTGIEASLSKLKGYRFATDKAVLTANAMQSVFGHIDRLTDGLSTSLLHTSTLEGTRTLDAVASDAARRLDSVLSALNTKLGDSALFAGIATDGAAVTTSDVILTALEASIATSGATTASDINTTVEAWFASPTGFSVTGYLGSSGGGPMAISNEDKVELAITAADPALRDTIKSLALVALIDRKIAITDVKVGAELAQMAGTSLLQNHTDRAVLAGRLGLAQARIDQAQTRNAAEDSMLQLARSDLIGIDPYEAATRMEAAQTQLETLYSVTARLSRLSLVDFLR